MQNKKVLGEENSTSSLPVEEKLIKSDLTESTQEPSDTCLIPMQQKRTVPSSQTEGTIWLRYAPKDDVGEDSKLSTNL